jgi:hypothetical protein
MPKLQALMMPYRDAGAIRSVDALFVNLCAGDVIAATMLRHILYWLPRSIRGDRAVWRRASEWQQRTGLTRSAIYNKRRRARLEAAGLVVWVERAQGENVLHFRIEADRFVMAIADQMQIAYEMVRVTLCEMVRRVSPAKAPIPFPQVGVSLEKPRVSLAQIPLTEITTTSATELSTEQITDGFDKSFSVNAVEVLQSEGLSAAEANRYAALGDEKVRETVQAAQAARDAGKLRKTYLAYLRGALKKAEASMGMAQTGIVRHAPTQEGDVIPPLRGEGNEGHGTPCPCEPVGQDVFQRAMTQLEHQLDWTSWTSYVKRCAYGGLDDGVYVVRAANSYAREMCDGRLRRVIAKSFETAAGMPIQIRFE